MKRLLDLFGLCSKRDILKLINIGVNATDTKDEYNRGMKNGMLWVREVITDKTPIYFEKRE